MGSHRILATVAASMASAASILALAYNEAHAAATVSFTSPSSGQSYAVDAPISYTGNGSWIVGTDSRTRDIDVDLVWIDPAIPNDTGTIVNSASPDIDFAKDQAGAYTGSYTFSNATDSTGMSSLLAKQRELDGVPQTSPYSLRAMPTKVGNVPYSDGSGSHVTAFRKLGTITP